MVVSLGADWAADRVPGLVEFGHTFATVAGVQLLAGELKRMESGRIVVVTAAPVYNCPAAPYEAALLIDAELRSRGIRDRFEIAIRSAEPAPMPAGGPEAVSYTHLRAHETVLDLVCRLLLEKKKYQSHNERYQLRLR